MGELWTKTFSSTQFKTEKSKQFNTQAFNKEVKAYFNLLHLPGLSVAVVRDGKVIYRQMEGFADVEKLISVTEDHIFHLASLTKTFTAALLMQYEQEGKASVEDYLLQYPFLVYGWPIGGIQNPNLKLKHVLSHTTEGEPGTAFIYNGKRYNFIYGVFEKVNGQGANLFLPEMVNRIVKPLNLKSTITGAPSEKTQDSILSKRVVKSYFFDKGKKLFN